jgi:hypothetical protein
MSRLASAPGVLDHRFGAGRPFSLGVEEEYMLLDADTLALVQRVESILRGEENGEFSELVSAELFESLVEFHSTRRSATASPTWRASCSVSARTPSAPRSDRACGSARRGRTRSACSSTSE